MTLVNQTKTMLTSWMYNQPLVSKFRL